MSWSQIKRDKSDVDFSTYIRLKAKKCARCGRRGIGGKGITGLQASHFHSRRKWSTRYDEENVDVLCIGCHKYFTEHRAEYKEWKLKQIGQKAYDRLEVVANATGKKDFKLMRIVWRAALRDLEEKLVRRIKT